MDLPMMSRHLGAASELWAWQDGTGVVDILQGATISDNGCSVLAGYTEGDWFSTNKGSADFAAVKLDADGEVLWSWQGGTGGKDKLQAAAMASDGSVLLAGYSDGVWEGSNQGGIDLAVVKLSADGEVEWKRQDGSSANETWYGVDVDESDGDESWVVAGTTFGRIGNESQGQWDFVARKLDSSGEVVWTWQDGTPFNDILFAVAVGEDGSVALGGRTVGLFGTDASGGNDYVAIKLDKDGVEEWRWQYGNTNNNEFTCVDVGPDGSIVMAGNTGAGGEDNAFLSSSHKDFAAVKFDTDGNVKWEWEGEKLSWSSINAVSIADDGSVLLSGYTSDSLNSTLDLDTAAGDDENYDFAVVKLDVNGTELWVYQVGTEEFDQVDAAALGNNVERLIVAGHTEGDYTTENAGEKDFLAVMLDVSAD